MRVDKSKWRKAILEEACEIACGTRVVKKKDEGSLYPVYGGGGATFFVDTFNRENAIVISRFAMSQKCTRFVSGKFFLNDSGLSLHPHNLCFDKLFFRYLIFSLNDKIYNLGRGAAQKNLDMKAFGKIGIEFPPVHDQQAIAEELDGIQSMIGKCREQLEDYDRLARSIFHEMFGDPVRNEKGWEICTLNDLCQFITDGTHQTPTYTEDKENGIKFLSAKDVTSGIICWDNIKYIPFELHQELHKRLAPQRNDILLCKNGTTGICALVETDEVFDIYVSLALLRPKEGILPKYIVSAINNPVTKYQFDRSLKGIGVPNLHLKEIKKAKVSLPPLPLQQQFAARIEAIEAMKEATKAQLADLQQLFDSRMQYYFS